MVPVAHPGCLTDELVGCGPDEVCELYLGDRPQAPEGRPLGYTDDRRLGQRSIDDPLLAELLEEALGRQEDPAPLTHVFAHDEDIPVPLHLLVHGLSHGL